MNRVAPGIHALRNVRFYDYLLLTKPELTLLSVATAVTAGYLACVETFTFSPLVHILVGTLFVGGGAGALNQYFERSYDALMKRTASRPIPSKRIVGRDALLFGIALSMSGIIYLLFFTTIIAAILGMITLITYIVVYTPLKRKTPFATIIGGIPGALPPLIGWSAVKGDISIEGWSLFFILYFWQMPHFLSLAWMYRQDYHRAGYKVLSLFDSAGKIVGDQIILYCIALLAASLLPVLVGLSGKIYLGFAVVFSLVFLWISLGFVVDPSNFKARKIFLASIVHLPALFVVMMLDKIH